MSYDSLASILPISKADGPTNGDLLSQTAVAKKLATLHTDNYSWSLQKIADMSGYIKKIKTTDKPSYEMQILCTQ